MAVDNTHSADLESSSSQYWSIADNASLSITGDLTIEFWINLESAPGTNAAFSLVGKWIDVSDEHSYLFQYQDVSGTKKFRFLNSDDGSAVAGKAGGLPSAGRSGAGTASPLCRRGGAHRRLQPVLVPRRRDGNVSRRRINEPDRRPARPARGGPGVAPRDGRPAGTGGRSR